MRALLAILLCISSLSLVAQRTTTTTTKTHRTSASNVHTNNGEVASRSSISRSSSSYKFSADFKLHKQKDIRATLMNHLNDQDLTLKNGHYTWQLENVRGIYFSCKLAEGTLSFHLDKTIAPIGSLRKAEALSDKLVAIISAHANMPYQGYDPQLSHPKNNENNNAELQQALRELEAARRKVERLGKKIDKGQED